MKENYENKSPSDLSQKNGYRKFSKQKWNDKGRILKHDKKIKKKKEQDKNKNTGKFSRIFSPLKIF